VFARLARRERLHIVFNGSAAYSERIRAKLRIDGYGLSRNMGEVKALLRAVVDR
jgi:hypothetical protein